MSVGTAVVSDLFFLHERGEKTGIYTVFVTNGAHFAVIGMSCILNVTHNAAELNSRQVGDIWVKQEVGNGTIGCLASLRAYRLLWPFSFSQRPFSLVGRSS